jgi:hypothetical protein
MSTPGTTLTNGNGTPNRPQRRKPPKTIDGATGALVPRVAPLQRTPLKTLEHVKRELGRVYRAMKAGAIEHADGTKRAYVLGQLSDVIEKADLERRLEALERQSMKLLPGAFSDQRGD